MSFLFKIKGYPADCPLYHIINCSMPAVVDSEKIPLAASFAMFLLCPVDSNSMFQLCTYIVTSFMPLVLSLCEVTKNKFFAQ